jgi:hypothetical protein
MYNKHRKGLNVHEMDAKIIDLWLYDVAILSLHDQVYD